MMYLVAVLEAACGSALIAIWVNDSSQGDFVLGAGIFFCLFSIILALIANGEGCKND